MTDVYAGRTRNGRMRFATPTAVRDFVHGVHSVTALLSGTLNFSPV